MASQRIPNSLSMSLAERRRRKIGQEAFWFLPTKNTLDRATAMMPRPPLRAPRRPRPRLLRALSHRAASATIAWRRTSCGGRCCRAYNVFTADQFRPYNDRIIPAAIIPMYTPEEAIEELRVRVAAARAEGGHDGKPIVAGPIPALVEDIPRRSSSSKSVRPDRHRQRSRLRPGLGEVPASCASPPSTTGRGSILLRNSPSNFCYNHIGHFASAAEAMAKALFLGGVTRRFPELNFAFLEGGVGSGLLLFADLIGHWEERQAGRPREHESCAPRPGRPSSSWREKYASTVVDAVRRGEGRRQRRRHRKHPELDDYSRCQDHAQGRLPRSLGPSHYFGARPMIRSTRRPSTGERTRSPRSPQRLLQLDIGHSRCARHDGGGARGLRAGRARPARRERLPGFHVRQRGALLGRGEPRLLQGHGRGEPGGGGARPASLRQGDGASAPSPWGSGLVGTR